MLDKINEAVILVGGMGTRLLPYTKVVSKEMLPILDVPMIYKLIEEAFLSGIKKIIFVTTPHNHNLIYQLISDNYYLNEFLKDKKDKQGKLAQMEKIIKQLDYVFVYQKEKGSYGALYSAQKYIENDNFIVMYCDDLIDCTIPLSKQLIDAYQKNHCMQVAAYELPEDKLAPNGIICMDKDNNLKDLSLKEKANTHLEVHGRMLLNKSVFAIKDQLKKQHDEYYLPHALLHFSNVKIYPYQGQYFNIGTRLGYIKASIYYAMQDKQYKEELLNFINELLNEK